jgi:hypothetical protein
MKRRYSWFMAAVVGACALAFLGCGDEDDGRTGAAGVGGSAGGGGSAASGGTAGDGGPAGSGGDAGAPGPCEGIDCSEPPPFCVGEATLREFSGPGQCVDGQCVYEQFQDEACTDCCFGAEINLTGNPIGGAGNYDDILSSSQASVVVSNAADLLQALADAQNGEVIYIDDAAEVDLTGQEGIEIPGGVYVDGQQTTVSGTNGGAWSGHLSLADSRVGGADGGNFCSRGRCDRTRSLRLRRNDSHAVYSIARASPRGWCP